jgi:hypothetical protein
MYAGVSKIITFIMLLTTVLGSQLFCIDADGCVDLSTQHQLDKNDCCSFVTPNGEPILHSDHHACTKIIQNLYANSYYSVTKILSVVSPAENPIYTIGFIKFIPENNFIMSFKVEIPPPILEQLSTVVILT